MDRLRGVVETIREQLSRLSASQRLLIGSLAVILLMTLFLVSQYAGSRELVPLMPSASAEEQVKFETALRASNVSFQTRTDGVYVPPSQYQRAVGAIAESRVLPSDAQILFSNLADKQSWTMNAAQHRQLGRIALQNELAGVISRFSGITGAEVFLDEPDRPAGLGQANRSPTATVTVFSSGGGGISQNTVDAIAGTVASAKSGLDIENVRVIDGVTNRQHRARGEDSVFAGDHREQTERTEEVVRKKLVDLLGYINGVVVAVNAQVDVRRMETIVESVLAPGEGTVTTPTHESTMERSATVARSGAEPGVRSNAGADISRGGGGRTGESESTTETDLETRFGTRREHIVDPRGRPTKVNATINVPRSYFVYNWRISQGADADEQPDEEALEAVIAAETARIRESVEPQLETITEEGEVTPGAVVVSMVPDPQPLAAGSSSRQDAGVFATGPGGGLMAGTLIKTIALGGMAIAALVMMAMALKKATRPVKLPTAEELIGVPPSISSDDEMFGEADETDAALSGIEMSDEDLQKRKLVDQVSSLVKERPDEAAQLVSHWVNSNH